MRDRTIILIFYSWSLLYCITIYETFKKIDFLFWLENVLFGRIRTVNELQTDGLKMIKAGSYRLCFCRVRVLLRYLFLWGIQLEGSKIKKS